MDIKEFPEVNVRIAENQPEYITLPVHKKFDSPHGEIVSCWKLSFKERIKILFTGIMWHSLWTFNESVQPQMMSVHKKDFIK